MPRVLQCCPSCARQYDVRALAAESPVTCSCGVTFLVLHPTALAPRAMCCSRCGGNLRDDARSCEYCQAEITLEERHLDAICPKCFARMSSEAHFCMSCGVRIEVQALAPLPALARCPRCATSLRSRRVESETLIECTCCAGLWVGPQLLERLCADAGARKSICEALGTRSVKPSAKPSTSDGYLPCPTCGELMNRKNFGSISGILIDVCKLHGVWLDHGELERALAFAEEGGLVEARRREIGELERRKQRAQSEAAALGDAWLEPTPVIRWKHSSGGGLLGWLANELLG